MNKSLCWSFHLGGFPDSGLESVSGDGFREDRDGVRSGSANGHDDDPRCAGESQRLCQVTVFLQRRCMVTRNRGGQSRFRRCPLNILCRQFAFIMAAGIDRIVIGDIGLRPFLLPDRQPLLRGLT